MILSSPVDFSEKRVYSKKCASFVVLPEMAHIVRSSQLIKDLVPFVHFYDQDFVDMYDRSWVWIDELWKQGTEIGRAHV